MCETFLAGGFLPGADIKDGSDGCKGRIMVFEEYHLKSIRQCHLVGALPELGFNTPEISQAA